MSVFFDGKALTREQIFDTNVDNRWKYLPIGYSCDEEGNWNRVWESMYLYSDEAFWGFGEKFTGLNKRGQKLNCWQKDALCTNTEILRRGILSLSAAEGMRCFLIPIPGALLIWARALR